MYKRFGNIQHNQFIVVTRVIRTKINLQRQDGRTLLTYPWGLRAKSDRAIIDIIRRKSYNYLLIEILDYKHRLPL